MPVYEGVSDPDEEVRLLTREVVALHARQLAERVIAEGDQAFREERLVREAEDAVRETRRQRMRAIARLKRPKRPGSKPWQSAGFAARADWQAAGSPGPKE